MTTPKDAYTTPAFASITTGPHHDEDTIVRLIQEQDIPVYYYACSNTLQGECVKASCKYFILALRGYLSIIGGKRRFVELPATPDAFYGYKCSEHLEELCDKCDVFLEGTTRFRVWEWDIRSRTFIQNFVKEVAPLRHGHFNRSLEKKQTRERRERAVQRNSTRKPYDSANSRARKTLNKVYA